jgi:hypothetical protein
MFEDGAPLISPLTPSSIPAIETPPALRDRTATTASRTSPAAVFLTFQFSRGHDGTVIYKTSRRLWQ